MDKYIYRQVSDEWTIFPFLTVSVSLRTSWLFYEQDVLLQFPSLQLFCQASGSKELNWAALVPTSLESCNCVALSCFHFGVCQLAHQQSHQSSLWTKTSLDSEVVRISKEWGEWQLVLLLVRAPDKIRRTWDLTGTSLPPCCSHMVINKSLTHHHAHSPVTRQYIYCFLKSEPSCVYRLFLLKAFTTEPHQVCFETTTTQDTPHHLSVLHVCLHFSWDAINSLGEWSQRPLESSSSI